MRIIPFVSLLIGLVCAATADGVAQTANTAQNPDFNKISYQIVNTSAHVKPGDVVVIQGGNHTIPLMEAIAIQVSKAGGFPNIILNSAKAARAALMDEPLQYLAATPKYLVPWFQQVDVNITLPTAEDEAAFQAGIPQERLTTQAKSFDAIAPAFNQMKMRTVNITFPTEARGIGFKIDGKTYTQMIWSAMADDNAQLAQRGAVLQERLQRAKIIRIVSPAGTDFTVALAQRPVLLDVGALTPTQMKSTNPADRTVSFPGGNVTVVPNESSANGKVAVPMNGCRFEQMKNATFTFKAGTMQNFHVDTAQQCWNAQLVGVTGAYNKIGSIAIGLNPAWKVHEENGAVYYPAPADGLVTLSVGDNLGIGGTNRASGGFGYAFPIMGATVYADGEKIIDNGKLVLKGAQTISEP